MDVELSPSARLRAVASAAGYQIVGELGRGADGQVLAARHGREWVAIKVLDGAGVEAIHDLKREYRVARDVTSSNVVAGYALIAEGGCAFIVMPLVHGCTLETWAREVDFHTAPERLLRVLAGVLAGLADLHEAGLVHRDLKPTNVLVTADDEALIGDLGLAEAELPPFAAGTSAGFSGTLAYAPPEALLDPAVSPAHDLFAWGMTAYEVITGRLPERDPRNWQICADVVARDIRHALPEVPAALLEELCTALDRDPEHRRSARAACARLLARARPLPAPAAAVRGESEPLIGRAQELEQLYVSLSQTSAKLAVLGPSGIGKSALTTHALERLVRDGEPCTVLSGRCHPGEKLPFRGLDEAIDGLAHALTGELEEACIDATDRAVLCASFPLLGRVLNRAGQTTLQHGARGSLTEQRSRLAGALAALFVQAGVRRRIVLWIDDIHWLDPDGEQLLSELLQCTVDAPLSLVLSGRELSPALAAHVPSRLDLGPLDPAHSLALSVARASRSNPAFSALEPPSWQLEAAGGNPAMLCHLADFFSLTRSSCASLAEVVRVHFRELPAKAVELASAMSLLGHPTPVALAQHVVASASHRKQLNELMRVGFVRSAPAFGAEGFALSHDSLREAILAQIAEADRERLHGALARGLEAIPGSPPELQAAQWESAGELRRARALFLLAGQRAADALAFAHAAHCFARALAVSSEAERLMPLSEFARVRGLGGHAQEAAHAFEECAARADGDGRRAYLQQAAAQYFLIGENARATALVNDLLGSAGVALPRSAPVLVLRLAAQWLSSRLGLSTRGRGRTREEDAQIADVTYEASSGLSHTDLALGAYAQRLHFAHGLRSGCPRRMARALALEAGYCAMAGARTAEVAALLGQARERAGEHDDPRLSALFSLVEAAIAWSHGRWSGCVEHALAVEQAAESDVHGAWWEIGFVRAVMLDALRWSGRYAELAERTARYLSDADARGDRFASVTFRTRFSSRLRLLADDPQAAWADTRSADAWPSRGVHLQHLAAFHARSECLLYAGAYEQALSDAHESLRRMRFAPLLRSVAPRAKATYQLATCRLAVAASAGARADRALLQHVRSAATCLRKPGWPYLTLLAELLETSVRTLEGRDVSGALTALGASARALGMLDHAAAIGLSAANSQRARTLWLGELRELGAADPLRFAAMLVPALLPRG